MQVYQIKVLMLKTVLLLLLTWAVSPVLSISYHIIPHSNETTTCDFQFEACLTLQQFTAKNNNLSSTLELVFAPGRHFCLGGITFGEFNEVTLRGQNDSTRQPQLTCQGLSCFSFINTSKIHIENLVFTECISKQSSGGAFDVRQAELVNITQCSFIGNRVQRNGGAIRIIHTSSVHILQTQFLNNSVACSKMDLIIISNAFILCSQNCIGYGGALLLGRITHAVIQNSVFYNNQASRYGGALYLDSASLSILNSTFSKNSAHCFGYGGGALMNFNGQVEVLNSVLEENRGHYGGAIFSHKIDSKVMILNSSLSFNSAVLLGGAGFFIGNSLQISETTFSYNSADTGGAIASAPDRQDITNISKTTFYGNTGSSGGALYLRLSGEPSCTASQCKDNLTSSGNPTAITIANCVFKSNICVQTGSAIHAFKGVLNITGCTFTDQQTRGSGTVHSSLNILHIQDSEFYQNEALRGGAFHLSNAVLNSLRNDYIDNDGQIGGGAISAINSTIFVRNDWFFSNRAQLEGGAIRILFGYLSSMRCNFSNNSSNRRGSGGAVSVEDGEFVTNETVYESNSSFNSGGALILIGTITSIFGAIFTRNSASFQGGAAIFQTDGYIRMNNVTLTNNLGRNIFDMYTVQLTNSHGECNTLTLSNNIGSIYMLFSVLNFSGDITFTENVGQSGGALTLIQSTVTFSRQSQLSISNNNATFGGAISLSQSTLQLNSPAIVMTNNRATVSGGAIYCFQSRIGIESIENNTLGSVFFNDNWAVEGGAINQIASTLNIFKGSVLFSHNQGERGGAIYLSESSQILILKTKQEPPNKLSILLTFSNNTANYGGAVFVLDTSNTGGLCETSPESVRSISSNECFIQVIRLYYPKNFTLNKFNYFNTLFLDNFASSSGNDIFGGLLDRCKPSSFAEIVINFFLFGSSSLDGMSYLEAIVRFQTGIDYDQIYPYNPLTFQRIITRHDLKGLISSNSTALCFCMSSSTFSCSISNPTIYVQRGQSFSIWVVTVDQVENPVNGTVLATVLTTGTSLGVDQARQNANDMCTELFYNVFSTQVNASIQLYPDGPCSDMGISSKQLNIAFLPCECPQGLQPAALDNECRCECSSDLNAVIDQCMSVNDNMTIVRRTEDFWIQYAIHNDSTMAGFVFSECPFDYCRSEPINLTITLPSQADTQCANNRSGVMCGECAEGLSLVFGSSRCTLCSDNYLSLLIAFTLAGIVLVAFILASNMTVAVGTIHGLILYANIIGANDPIFLPSNTALRVFVSWVNLDLGIETCFYNGMDSYAKVLLQLVFPAYIISLSVLIIIISYYWGWFGGLIGRRNPVATLCTLFLLSYSKLLRTIIASLQFVSLTFPTGLTEVLWLYNPNIYYLTPARVPIFITATVILVFGSIYTMFLFFAQWLRKLRKVKCIRNPKYIAFIDAYQAPFSSKHRYWIGILLLTRILHHLLTAVLSESTQLLTVSCLVSTLLIFKQLINHAYKNWLVDLLETSFLINLLLFAVSTYYVSITRGDQLAVANTSVIIAFITFCGIFLYHTHTFLLSDVRAYQNWITTIKSSFITKDSQRRNNPSRYIFNSHQREADYLDIISPILPQDYEVPVPPPTHTRPVTTTIVEMRELDAEQDDPEQQDLHVPPSPAHLVKTTTTAVDIRELDEQEEEQDFFSTPYQTY